MTQTLAQALENADMIIIDELYAFAFELADTGLTILCMDGRTERRWHFSLEAVAHANFVAESDQWHIVGSDAEHRLRLLDAFSAEEDDDQE
jgi:hypothetical protein